jgi:hypothetical protein
VSIVLEKAIFPFSPGKVANAENWFGSSGENMKVPDAKIVTSAAISARLHTIAFVDVCSGGVDNDGDKITLSQQHKLRS